MSIKIFNCYLAWWTCEIQYAKSVPKMKFNYLRIVRNLLKTGLNLFKVSPEKKILPVQ